MKVSFFVTTDSGPVPLAEARERHVEVVVVNSAWRDLFGRALSQAATKRSSETTTAPVTRRKRQRASPPKPAKRPTRT